RSRAQFRETDLLEGDVGEVKNLRSSRLILSVHPVLVVLVRSFRNALLGLGQEVRALAKDHRSSGAHRRACGLLILLQALIEAELAFDDLRIPLVPFELRNIERAGHLTVAAPDTARTIPCHSAPLALRQRSKWAAGYAGGIEAVHALPFDEGEVCSTRFLVELDNVL